MGEMLHASWEPYATRLANADSDDALVATLEAIVAETSTDLAQPAHIVYGHDTRPSCRTLVRALVDGLASTALSSSALETELVNAGLVTTPQLHYLVRCLNTAGTLEEYGEPSVEGYYRKLATAYTNLSVSCRGRVTSCTVPSVQTLKRKDPAANDGLTPSISSPDPQQGRHLLPAITVDCANGVGAPKLKEFVKVIGADYLPVLIVRDNTTTAGQLNSQCGADYVKTQQRAPPGVDLVPWQRYCSFDGDADRIVYYYADGEGVFHGQQRD